jgi:hypothetical protein
MVLLYVRIGRAVAAKADAMLFRHKQLHIRSKQNIISGLLQGVGTASASVVSHNKL